MTVLSLYGVRRENSGSSRAGLPLLAAALLVGCSDDATAPDAANHRPVVSAEIPGQYLVAGSASAEVDLSPYFSDPDGDGLTFETVSSDTSVVAAALADSLLSLSARADGEATVTVIAVDPQGTSVATTLAVRVMTDADRAALVALYEATDGPNWVNNENWLTDAPLGEWYGVSVSGTGRVTMLELSGEWDDDEWEWVPHGLAGPIPPQLANLTELQTLVLYHNRLTGPIPSELATLANLTNLELNDNDLTGPIPPELGTLANLAILNLDNNDLTGEIPSELGSLANLRRLELNYNDLTGPIPSELATLANLTSLVLSGNDLTGPIPSELGALANLTWLGLGDNDLTGEIPPELGNLSSLENLDLAYNRLLTGSIPPELGGLTSLQYLSLSGTFLLDGAIPPEFGNLTSLTSFYLSWTGIGGPLPPELGNLSQLRRLVLRGSGLTGPIPSALGSLENLERLNLSWNYLGGPIPPELGNLSSLRSLDLSYNEFLSGEIPGSLGDLTNLNALRLDRNLLEGPIPLELGNLELLETLELFRNQLTGPIPPELGNLELLESLGLYGNQLTGPVPESFARLEALRSLRIHNNALSGPLPDGMGALGELQELWVGNNPELTGPLPADLAELGQLESLKAGGTGLCVPDDEEFLEWLTGVPFHRIARCEGVAAYLTQSVQSRTNPVPLIAGEPALLRAFVASPDADGDTMPAARATFYLEGAPAHEIEIEPESGTIPGRIEESEASLERSINADVPGWLVQRGLEFVVEVDPDGALDPALGVTGRIPPTGRMAVDVVELQDLRLTLVPFLHETEMMRQIEGRPGYWLSMQGPIRLGLLGVAWDIPSWSSFSQPIASTIAHELGHSMGLWHAPCGGAGGPDPLYPHPTGLTTSWGYDMANRRLVSPHSPDLMSYCGGQWIGDYHRANALRHRMKSEADAAFAARVPSLVVWGGLDADGKPYLDPAFLTDAMPTLPPEGREFTLRVTTEGGSEAVALDFDMPSIQDAQDGLKAFVFSVPVTWTGTLESIALVGSAGSAVLDRDTDRPFTIVKDRATGQVRAFLRGRQPAGVVAADATGAAGYETLFSAGVPDSN